MHVGVCEPDPEECRGQDFEGFHLKPLKAFHDRQQVEAMANKFGCRFFWCEYGQCWHLSRS